MNRSGVRLPSPARFSSDSQCARLHVAQLGLAAPSLNPNSVAQERPGRKKVTRLRYSNANDLFCSRANATARICDRGRSTARAGPTHPQPIKRRALQTHPFFRRSFVWGASHLDHTAAPRVPWTNGLTIGSYGLASTVLPTWLTGSPSNRTPCHWHPSFMGLPCD